MKSLKYLSFVFLFIVAACGDDDTDTVSQQTTTDFDRSAMLVHWADNIIIPSYRNFSAQTATLETATNVFVATPTLQNLTSLQSAWQEAYIEFQKVAMFEIGKAEQLNFRNRLNVYPANTLEIEDLIMEGAWDFALPATVSAQGFPALDYLLFGLGDANQTLTYFTSNPNAISYKNYLTSLSQTINTLTTQVLADWENGFRDAYVSNTSSTASGSVDKTANAFMFYYEKALRAGKVGIPAGVFSPDPLPLNVEALYKADISKILLQTALTATQDFFNGKSVNSSAQGQGFKSYLDFLNTIKNGSDLSTIINNQFEATTLKITDLKANFNDQVVTDNSKMLETYDALQRNVVLLKVDMFQALSIDITYVDADGD